MFPSPRRSSPRDLYVGVALGAVMGFFACVVLVSILGMLFWDSITAQPAPQTITVVVTDTPTVDTSTDVFNAPAAEIEATMPDATPTEISPTPTPIQPRLGDVVSRSGYFLAALTLEDPATRPGRFYQPQPGKKLVAVEFVVGNESGEVFSSNQLWATLVDSRGFLYRAENTVLALEDNMELIEVHPGEMVRGWVGFIIPNDAIPTSLKYNFGSSGVQIQTGLIP